MRLFKGMFVCVALALAIVVPRPTWATDTDGVDDCLRSGLDFGDAPEAIDAYPGVPGRFPTCLAPGPVGTQELACAPISTPPGPAGYVTHAYQPNGFWLIWNPGGPPSGIDPEPDGKVASWTYGGPSASACSGGSTDCAEVPWAPPGWWQDECYGSTDAGLAGAMPFTACVMNKVVFGTYNCAQTDREVFLNILVDWNQDGDWNDNFMCPGGGCAYEWAVKNAVVMLAPGGQLNTSPNFLAGPNPGHGWMRITISSTPVNDDFPWAGTAQIGDLEGGETEDYPVEIEADECGAYQDFGDAPEAAQAYAGVPGHFPTCTSPSAPGTQELTAGCPALSTAPGTTGYVEHVRNLGDPFGVWLGCPGVDGETDGKTNDNGSPNSVCAPTMPAVDCFETAWLNFGQDECTGDGVDAGIQNPVTFRACQYGDVTFDAYNCGTYTVVAILNILVDWNHDGDWNDNFDCPGVGCAPEWAVKNHQITLPVGCTTLTSPQFLAGPFVGVAGTPQEAWMRITITRKMVRDDFPWAGSVGEPGDVFETGETEDYPVEILDLDECGIEYEDFGDAPEDVKAYTWGQAGRFPTCLSPSPPGTQEIECGAPSSSTPGQTGFVRHVASALDAKHFWLGCGVAYPGGVDSEPDGKMNQGPGLSSFCNPGVIGDCLEPAFLGAMSFAQDECTGDGVDAGIHGPVSFPTCATHMIHFDATNCGPAIIEVYLNVLVDWNGDADWNDNILCPDGTCAPEWAVRNYPLKLAPGCNPTATPVFQTGPHPGLSWMRITLTPDPVSPDFPWAGSATTPGEAFKGGETEDYPAMIPPLDVGDADVPDGMSLAPAWPNPATTFTVVRYALPHAARVSLGVFDVTGRRIRTLASGEQVAGRHTVRWDFRSDDGANVPAGLYLVKLQIGGTVLTRPAVRVE